MANKVRDTQKFFSAPIIPNAPPEYNPALEASKNTILRFYFQGIDEALRQALQFDSDDIIDGSIPDSKLEARYLRKDQNDTTEYTLTVGGLVVDTDTLYVDAVNNRVGILTTTPSEALDVVGNVQATEFIGDLRGAVVFKAQAGEDLTKGDVVYISGISGNTTVVSKADANDSAKMPAFGLAAKTASNNTSLEVYTFGTLSGIDTSSYSEGDELFVGTTAGALVSTAPTGESSAVQKIAKVTRSHASAGSVKVIGAGRTNATPNLNNGNIFMGNASNIATTVSFDTKVGDYITANPITNAQLAGSITNAKLVNDSVSYGGVSLDLGQSDATPAFDLSDATNYPTSSLSGTITNAQLAGSIANSKLANDSVSYGGVSLDLGQSDATPAFDLSDATNYPTSSLSGTIATAQIADDAVNNAKLADNSVGTSQLGDLTVTTAKIVDSNVTTNKIADDAVTSAKITGPFSSKHSFFSNTSVSITSTSPVTIRQFSIPAPPAGNQATQSLTLTLKMRFHNSSSSSSKLNHQFKVLTQMVSKTATGTSVGTWQFVSVPSTYNAWYKVNDDITDTLASGMGKLGTTAAGANAATIVEYYYASGYTYVRISKFPDPQTVFNGVTVFYSKSGFTSAGTYVAVPDFYSQTISLPPSSYEMRMIPLTFSFGKETTESTLRIQFDHVSSTTNLNTHLFGYYGFTENTV